MNELIEIDKAIFYFINGTLSNPVTDYLMPIITSFKYWLPLYIFGILYLIYRFRLKGLYILIVLLFVVGLCDFLNAQLLKEYIARVRPCRALDNVNLLVHCGSGYSFPSNHSINNFAAATVLSHYFRRKKAIFIIIASLVALSRVMVGVHYLSDITAGALLGVLVGLLITYIVNKFDYNTAVREKIRIN